ncbi:hypothetical protein OY671_011800, partial [Metschnikowia pulcherrima]
MEKYGVGGEKKQEEVHEEKKEEKKETVVKQTAEETTNAPEQSGTSINNEKKQQGLIGWNVYWYYFKKGKAGIFILMTIFLSISVFSRIVGSWWLTQWTNNKY